MKTLIIAIFIISKLFAHKVNITQDIPYVDIEVDGKKVRIERVQDTNHKLNNDYTKTSRPTPPFFIQPFKVDKNIQTVGELDLIKFLKEKVSSHKGILIDARLTKWYENGTIPFAINLPFSMLSSKDDRKLRNNILSLLGGKELFIFDNGPWCAQARTLIKELLLAGYPKEKIKYYRGGMQFWQIVGLNVTIPQKNNSKLSQIRENFIKIIAIENHIINLSGKQRMLTQKMSKDAISLSFDKDAQIDLLQSIKSFDTTLKAIKDGNSSLNIPQTDNNIVKKQIEKIYTVWNPFKKELENIIHSKGDLNYIINNNLQLLKLSDELVTILKKSSHQNYIIRVRKNIVDLAGKQRMLIERMTKDKLIIELNLATPKIKDDLQKSIDEFEKALSILLNGDTKTGIPKSSNKELKERYKELKKRFAIFKERLGKQNLSIQELINLNKESEKLLDYMDRTVLMSEELKEY